MSAISPFGHKTLLQLVQQACGELGIAKPNAVATNQDMLVQQLLAQANREGREMHALGSRLDGWQMLRKENVWQVASSGTCTANVSAGSNVIALTSTPAVMPQVGWGVSNSGVGLSGSYFNAQTYVTAVSGMNITVSNAAASTASGVTVGFAQWQYTLPSDIDMITPGTMFDRSMRWPMIGPVTPQEWQVLCSSINPTGPRRRFRIMSGTFDIFPIPGPTDTSTLVYEYYSNGWCQSSGGQPQQDFAADTDTYLLDDDSMVLGIIWRFRRAKGLAWEDDFRAHQRAVDRAMGGQAGSRTLPLDATATGSLLLTTANIPDSGYGS